ncbi:hypothetical protein KUC14_21130 [Alteromonas sp. KC14]|uniref:hypothetical protein n=1 Tax=Alteromonas sp. KC14 TaxID=2795689 RepID=UPI00193838D4|nr:hypothetical protein [Alteromonas sp. KC14]BCO23244.1 hypothetical protein KUC14_21130 [Alteromonas sp. KC14]
MRKILVGILLSISWNAMASYSLYIERDNPISVREWLTICESDSSLTVQHAAKVMNPETVKPLKSKLQMVAFGLVQFYAENIISHSQMAALLPVATRPK